MTFDRKCFELAQHFLADTPGATELLATELAERIQSAVEDYFSDMEEERNYDRDR